MRSLFVVAIRIIGFYGLYESVLTLGSSLISYYPWHEYLDSMIDTLLYELVWVASSGALLFGANKIADILKISSSTDLNLLSITEQGLLKVGIVIVGIYGVWAQLWTIPGFLMGIGSSYYLNYAGADWAPVLLRFLWISIPIWIILSADWIVKVVYRKSDGGGE